jgi:nucleotide-binding universal stress UspA family protein
MFHKVVAAYNDSPEAERALISAIKLTKMMNGELQTVTVKADLPGYTAFAGATDPAMSYALQQDL